MKIFKQQYICKAATTNVQKVPAPCTTVHINIIMLPVHDVLLSELICIIQLNELKLQECAVFVLGSCQVLTSVLKVQQAAAEKEQQH